ncbi:MAG: METTL5 family protein [Halobaculum sp.]
MNKRAVERRLTEVAGFSNPQAALEQYRTPPDIAAHLLHVAAMQGDVTDSRVLDLGTGTGTLALAAALHDPVAVLGFELDSDALATARENEGRVAPPTSVDWILADATAVPLCFDSPVTGERADRTPLTVVTNPPFGARDGNESADRRFLGTIADLASDDRPVVSYSVHNEGSRTFVESFAADNGGEVTAAFRVTFPLDRQFDHHSEERVEIDAEVYRIEWV